MTQDWQRLTTLAGAGSAALLLAAFYYQFQGYAPCELCLLQRWPHVAAVLIAGLAVWRGRNLALIGAGAAALAVAFALYHTGVEAGWWPGPSACTGGPSAALSTTDLLAQIRQAPLVRCDDISWQFWGLSMAAWNTILSFALLGIWVLAGLRRAKAV